MAPIRAASRPPRICRDGAPLLVGAVVVWTVVAAAVKVMLAAALDDAAAVDAVDVAPDERADVSIDVAAADDTVIMAVPVAP